jgi:uncharacterized protein with PhoU and TrkA domain
VWSYGGPTHAPIIGQGSRIALIGRRVRARPFCHVATDVAIVIALISVLTLITLFLTVARVASVVLEVTGMSRSAAEFQARSALLGVGFTTVESEEITGHPVRRRIVLWLMTFGNVGAITGVGSFIIAFGNTRALQVLQRSGELVAGVVLLLVSVHISAASRVIATLTRAGLRRFTSLEVSSLTTVAQPDPEHAVAEIRVERSGGLAGRTLGSLNLEQAGVTVLGIRRHDGSYVGSPSSIMDLRHGDVVTAYGRTAQLSCLARPRASRSTPPGPRPARR